jgi:dienelactone hydrolase
VVRDEVLKAPRASRTVRAPTPGRRFRRFTALVALLTVAATYGLLGATSAGPTSRLPSSSAAATRGPVAKTSLAAADTQPPVTTTVGLRVVTFVDHTRVARFHGGKVEPRTLVTQIRYPALGAADADDVADAAPLPAGAPYPLIVFGPGFAETPTIYAQLLDAWARAGYIVAAPSFPLTQKHVPGGRRQRDLINQPGDMSFVISSMLADNQNPASFLHGLIAPDLIAVAGQSDGAATALAEAYDPTFADPRIRAALILSGAELSTIDDDIPFQSHGPALLATQGSADTINEPSSTTRYFELAPRPKYLLTLIGATHLPPYTTQQPYLGVVERVSIAFLRHVLRNDLPSLAQMRLFGNVSGIARLTG